MNDYEAGRKRITELAGWYSKNAAARNEATTRLHLVDSLFFECLGWSKLQDVELEEPHGKDYSDYSFKIPRRCLIVEAKKEGDYFELPAGKQDIERSIKALMRDYKPLKAAIEQAAGYGQKRGVPVVAVCNGHQIVAFVAARLDGTPPLEGTALVFDSIGVMISRFLDLWQALSKPGIIESRLIARLVGDSSQLPPPKLAVSIGGYPGMKARNDYQADLQILSELVFEDIPKAKELEEEFLKHCYCQSGAISQHSLETKSILQLRYGALFTDINPGPSITPAADKKGKPSNILAEGIGKRPILLVGDVGVGKTSFIRNLLKVEAADFMKNAIALYLDLGSRGTITKLSDVIIGDIIEQLKTDYKINIYDRNFVHAVYSLDLIEFDSSIDGDLKGVDEVAYKQKRNEFLHKRIDQREEHVRRSIDSLVKGRKKPVVLFLDNVDQRDYPIQQEAFLIAHEIAANWPVVTFLTIRPETFHRSQRTGALSGYHPKAFTISPPRVDLVVNKRLEYAMMFTSGKAPLPGTATTVELGILESIIKAMLYSLKKNEELVGCLDNISGGNIRLALDLVRNFFGSGHVNTRKIAETQQLEGSYDVPLHEFLRAAIYGDAAYFDPSASLVANLFDVSVADPREHFLAPILLSTIASLKSAGGEAGFVELRPLYEALQSCGFTPSQIDAGLVRCYDGRLVETNNRQPPNLLEPSPFTVRITTVGLYHVYRLNSNFQYYDAIVVDTPILDKAYRDRIANVYLLEDRLNRCNEFRKYLTKIWDESKFQTRVSDWPEHARELEEGVKRIWEQNEARRRYPKAKG